MSGSSSTAQAIPLVPTNNASKKLKHKSSKPIITWITRKLGGSGNHRTARPLHPDSSHGQRQPRGRTVSLHAMPSPQSPLEPIILNDDLQIPLGNRISRVGRISPSIDSSWTKASLHKEADDDASIRPLPPTSPPSPVPSRSSSSQFSDPRTFRSGAASTKPTTVVSVDSANGPGVATTMAHIAQVPSQVPPSPSGSRVAGPLVHPAVARAASQHRPTVQAPLHTAHHPRNNPHPSSPPPDNASTLTLASSAFASPGRANDWADAASLSISYHYGDGGDRNSYHIEDDEMEIAASMRALRPRSSRRGSWDSNESRWSALVGFPNAGTPSIVSGVTRAPSIGGLSSIKGGLKLGPAVTEPENKATDDQETAPKQSPVVKSDSSVHRTSLVNIDEKSPITKGSDSAFSNKLPASISEHSTEQPTNSAPLESAPLPSNA